MALHFGEIPAFLLLQKLFHIKIVLALKAIFIKHQYIIHKLSERVRESGEEIYMHII